MKIGEKIQTLRKSNGISQEVLAQRLNVNRNCLSRVETCKVDPTISMVLDISAIFNVSVESLLGVKDNSISYEEKIKEITDGCYYLTNKDLDFVLRMVSILREEYVKRSNN